MLEIHQFPFVHGFFVCFTLFVLFPTAPPFVKFPWPSLAAENGQPGVRMNLQFDHFRNVTPSRCGRDSPVPEGEVLDGSHLKILPIPWVDATDVLKGY